MRKIIFRPLGVAEWKDLPQGLVLLLAIGFCIGVFLATLSVASTTLFLNAYSETEDLPMALLLSGALAIFFTGLYSFLQSRIPFNALVISSLTLLICMTALVKFGSRWFEGNDLLYYFAFTLLLPFTFVSRLIFWGAFNRLFNLRQARHALSIVDVGMDLASVLSFFAIPVILGAGADIAFIFSLSLVSVLCFLALYIVLSPLLTAQAGGEAAAQKLSTRAFFKSRYVLSMAFFVVISTVVARFVDYTFFNVTTMQFDTDDIPYFLSYFEATIVTFSFLFTVFVTDRINYEYGTRVSLLITPLLMFFFMALALGLGYLVGYDPALNSAAYFFFIMIAMGKLFISSMREAIDEPTLKLYYIPFNRAVKNDVQVKIEGVVMGGASFMAGGVVLLVSRFAALDLLSIVLIIVVASAIWYQLVNYMHQRYRGALRLSLEKNKASLGSVAMAEYTTDEFLKEQVTDRKEEKKVIYGLKLMERINPGLFERSVLRLAGSPLDRVRRYAQQKRADLGSAKRAIEEASSRAEQTHLSPHSSEGIITLAKSPRGADRKLAAQLLAYRADDKMVFILVDLLRDADFHVRSAALEAARKARRPETWGVIIDMLNSPLHANQASSALKQAGTPALDYLNAAFYKTGQSDAVMQRMVAIIGAIGGGKAIAMLWKKMDYPDAQIVDQALRALSDKKYTARDEKALVIKGLLDAEMSKMLWNLAALDELPREARFELLRSALKEEARDNYDQIILMLSLLYDRQSIQLVKESIDSGSAEGNAYALELLNLFVDTDLKARLIPLLEDTPTHEKLEKLQLYFPRQQYSPEELLNAILNRSFSYNNRWTKLCAIHTAAHARELGVSQSLIAQAFNPDKIIQETAAWTIYNKSQRVYDDMLRRLPQEDIAELDLSVKQNKLIDGLDDGYFLKIEVVILMRQLALFNNVKGRLLCDIADQVEQIALQKKERRVIESESDDLPILIVAHGSISLAGEGDAPIVMKRSGVFGHILREAAETSARSTTVVAEEYAILFSIPLANFYMVLAGQHELAGRLMENEVNLVEA